MKYKLLLGAFGILSASVGASQAWTFWHLPVLATRDWVQEVQYPIQQNLQALIVGQKQARISAIKDLLVIIEEKKIRAAPGDRARYDQQARSLNSEWSRLEAEINSLEAIKR